MNKRLIALFMAAIMTVLLTPTVFADVNLGSDDGTGWGTGTGDNVWAVHTESGLSIQEGEGLRVTVYDAESNSKVFNTIDITGTSNLSAVSQMRYFADNVNGGTELIPKTSWLSSSYIGATYTNVSAAAKYNNAVSTRLKRTGYSAQYLAKLSEINIISENNSSNLEAIKGILGEENFLKNICDLIGGGLEYEDFTKGKYKIAFEPVAYFRYNGQNYALSATEVGVYNKFIMNNGVTSGTMKGMLGPLTHSNLPRSAFLEYKDLGIPVYSPAESDYWGDSRYNTDSCIIRCMGIGTVSADPPDDGDDEPLTAVSVAEYHTDTDVYTSFNLMNIGEYPLVGSTVFNIRNSGGETPKTSEYINSEQEIYKISSNSMGPPTFYKAYLSDELATGYANEDDRIKVFVDNPRYVPDENGELPYGVAPYKLLGTYKNGDEINISSGTPGKISYTVKTLRGSTVTRGSVDISCPAGEETMGWFKWHTPTRAQSVVITLKSSNENLVLLDDNGNACEEIVINADIAKVEEITPPDPAVTDKRPSWQKVYSMSSVQDRISGYVSADSVQELSWYTWTFGASWYQDWDTDERRIRVITGEPDYDKEWSGMSTPYLGCETEREDITFTTWGVNNKYLASENARRESGKFYPGAVYISTNDIQMEKVECSVSLSADMTISPSEHCYTATYSNSSGKYTMKSGYGIQIDVSTHLDGDTAYCTGSQTANVLFPEFNYNRQSTAKYNRLLEKDGTSFVFKKNKYSTYNDRVHFTPIWYPDNKSYTVYAEVFDVWCPAGQLSVRITDQMIIKGNVYDDWHIAPTKP